MRGGACLLAAALVLALCAGPGALAGEEIGDGLPVETPALTQTQPPVPPQEGGERLCGTLAELREALSEGGVETAVLTGDIWCSDWEYLEAARPVTVRMGEYAIYVPPGMGLTVGGPVRFEGGAGPLFRVEGNLITGPEVSIAAQGDGAVAVWVRCSVVEEGSYDGAWDSELSEASARGPGATALRVTGEGEFLLNMTCLTAEGAGAAAVRAEIPAEFILCSLRGEAASVEAPAGGLVLDGCRAEPAAPGAAVIEREVQPNRLPENGFSVPVGAQPEGSFGYTWDNNWFEMGCDCAEYWFYDKEDAADPYAPLFPVVWSGLPEDVSAPMESTARYRAVLPGWFPVEVPEYTAPVHVVEPDKPHLMNAYRMGPDVVVVCYLMDIQDANSVVLQYREEKGGPWRDAAEIPGSEVSESSATIGGLEPNRDYLLRLVVEGGPMEGVSGALRLRYYEGNPDRGGSGDRDDGDRGDQGEDPPNGEIIPPPEESTGGGGQWEQGPSPAPVPTPEPEPGPAPPTPSPSGEPAVPTPAPTPEGAAVSFTAEELADQLLANPVQVTLVGEGIKAALPTALLEDMELGAGESFSAALAFTPGRFSVAFWAGERPLEDLGGPFTVEVAWAGETAPRCRRPGGPPVEADRYGDGRAVFTLSAPGTYTILEEPVPAGPVTQAPPAVTGAPFTSPAAGTAPPAGGSNSPGASPDAGINAAESVRPTPGPGGPSPAPSPGGTPAAPGPETTPAAPSPEQTARGDAEEEAERSSAVPVLAALGLCGLGGFAAWRWRRGRRR